jgi:nitrogen fixation-related uncharacterized protein
MSIGQTNQKIWKNRRMIVNIGHRRTKINHTYAYTKNSLELLALLLPMMMVMLFVYLSAMLMCLQRKEYDDGDDDDEKEEGE